MVETSVCGNMRVEGTEECDDGNNNPYDACFGCQRARCRDRYIQRANNEDCEENAFIPGWDDPRLAEYLGPQWTSATCNFDRCSRVVYTACAAEVECPVGNQCVSGVCTPYTCNENVPTCSLPKCPPLPGFSTFVVSGLTSYCFVECREGRNGEPRCPVGLTCLQEPLTGQPACVTAGAPFSPGIEDP